MSSFRKRPCGLRLSYSRSPSTDVNSRCQETVASRSSNQSHRHRETSSTFKDGTAMHREHQPRRQKENPEIDSEGEYILDQQRHRSLASEDSVKRQSRYQSPPRSNRPSRGSHQLQRSKERTPNCHRAPKYRTASEEDSSSDRRHYKESTSGYQTKSDSSRTRVERLQSPRVSSTRQDDRRGRTCCDKSTPRCCSRKYRRHSDSSSSSDDEHRSFDRAEPTRCYNVSRRRRDEDESSDEDSEGIAVRGRHRIRLRTFDGSGTFVTFWAHFENCASYNRWNNADKLAHLKASLVGNAGQVLWDSYPSSVNTLSKLVQLL